MVNAMKIFAVLLGVWAVAHGLLSTPAEAQLSPLYYLESCPLLFPVVGEIMYTAIQKEPRIAASLLRLHFHDCFVQGCDGSDLLDPIPGSTDPHSSEKEDLPNANSLRGFEVIDEIKAALEKICPNTVSCADVATVAGFYSVVLSGGPFWLVPLGRLDSFTAAPNASVLTLPGPSDNITTLKQKFEGFNRSLTVTDLVALSGGHTIGLFRCASIYKRLYNYDGTHPPTGPGAIGDTDPLISPSLLKALTKKCPYGLANVGSAGNVTNEMDSSPTDFDNLYYKQLLDADGVFSSDQELFASASDTKALVQLYASDQDKFFSDFATSITKMGNLNPKFGSEGEVRKNCRVRNPVGSSINEEKKETRSETPVEKIEGGIEAFEKTIKTIIKEIVHKKQSLERLVEETVSSGIHSSM